MAPTRLTKFELQIMEIFWRLGASAVREIQEEFPEDQRPAYTTIQTTVYRLETKGALRIVKRISNANIFEAALSRDQAQGRVIDELVAMLDGQIQPVMAHLARTGQLTLADIQEAERVLREHQKSPKQPKEQKEPKERRRR
jgi:BlaI family transcriptional regulator, penicillinase repressor